MAKKGLPSQGIKALMDSWDEANDMVVKSGEKEREQANKEFRDYVKSKK